MTRLRKPYSTGEAKLVLFYSTKLLYLQTGGIKHYLHFMVIVNYIITLFYVAIFNFYIFRLSFYWVSKSSTACSSAIHIRVLCGNENGQMSATDYIYR